MITNSNNTRFKIMYGNMDKSSEEHVKAILRAAQELSSLLNLNNREMNEAIVRLDECIMWAITAICITSEVHDE